MPSVISFDLDGTLCSMALNNRIYRQLIPKLYAEKNNLDFLQALENVVKEYEKVGNESIKYYDFDGWLKKFNIANKKNDILNSVSGYGYVYKDTIYAINELSKKYDLVICTLSPPEIARISLDILPKKFKKCYSVINQFKAMKTKETYKSICNDLGVKPIDVIHVGDSLKFDYIEPRKAGIKSYYLDRSGVTVKAKDVVYDLIEFADLLM